MYKRCFEDIGFGLSFLFRISDVLSLERNDALANAKRYLAKHTKRLESFGYKDIRAKIFEANKSLSHISKASFI